LKQYRLPSYFDAERRPILAYLNSQEPEIKKLSFSPEAVKPLEANPLAELGTLDTRIALIQALIPVGLLAVEEVLAQEVTALAGAHYQRKASAHPHRRWGQR